MAVIRQPRGGPGRTVNKCNHLPNTTPQPAPACSRIKMHAPDADEAEQQLITMRADFMAHLTLTVVINGNLQALASATLGPCDGSSKPPPD